MQVLMPQVWGQLKICISKKHPHDTGATGPQTSLWGASSYAPHQCDFIIK